MSARVHPGFIAHRHRGPVRTAALLLALAAAPVAADTAPQATELRLSPEEKAAILAAAADQRMLVIAPLDLAAAPLRDRRVHGSAAFYVGSNGGYGLSSTTVVPFGRTGVAAVSVATENVPRRIR